MNLINMASNNDKESDDQHFKLPKLAGRRGSRILIIIALYQWELTRYFASKIVEQIEADNNLSKIDYSYFKRATTSIIAEIEQIDATFSAVLDREFNQLTPIECAILRLATWELTNCVEIPYKVVINEAIELSKSFGTNDGYKYINGILNKLVAKLRPHNL